MINTLTAYTKNTRILNWLFVFCICHYFQVKAQIPPFVNLAQSKLYFSKDSSKFMNFYRKMDELKIGTRKKINIVHYGGSHIQAGFWTEVLMDGFQKLNKYEGGGTFIFPFKVVHANSPHFFKSFATGNWKRYRCATSKEMITGLGMAGIAGITNDSLVSFGFKLMPNNHHKLFNSVKVYHNFNASFELALTSQVGLNFVRKEYKEKGYTEFLFEGYVDSLNFIAIRKDTNHRNFMLRGFSIENNNPGFYYAAMGVNGASSNSYLRCTEFVNELKSIPPDLVIFSLGVNDTQGKDFTKQEFMANYDSLIVLIKKASPDCAILFTTTTDNYIKRKTSNKRPIKAEEAMFDLMEKHHAAVYDLYAAMGGYKSIYKWYKAGLAAKDKVHFNGRGYTIVGNLMFDAIEKSYMYNSKVK
jgi:lysophospholipase L1-like esterase